MEEQITLCVPSRWQFFRTFAGCHFLVSIIGVLGVVFCFASSALVGGYFLALLFLWEVILLAIYVIMGAWAAREMEWSAPRRFRDGFGAVIVPTLIAWVWGGAFLMMLFYRGGWEAAGYDTVATILFWSLLIFAFPSSWGYGMLTMMLPNLFGYYGRANEVIAMLLVGILPPVLFLLGSIWRSRRLEKKLAQISE